MNLDEEGDIPGLFRERDGSHVRKSLETKPINPRRWKNGKAALSACLGTGLASS